MHLLKCRNQHKGSKEMVTCDFNASHVIPKIELQYHHNECPDRKGVELHIFQAETDVAPIEAPLPAIPVPLDSTWEDGEVSSYDPQKYCEGNAVLRRIDAAPAAVRKDFQLQERKRFSEMKNKPNQGKCLPNAASMAMQKTGLPEAPIFSEINIEDAPEDISQVMQKLDRVPKKAIIARPHSK
ncbi:gametocyte-specific factor 1 homolog isoform X2 [Dendroctonus ponderosae]|nr:gametocyte-specific factor 1 homolog isoform X2 [Dendroctonus ponderosae]KAH0999135.1 hypothetical protein HUJ04_005359 [Dendroctonus ponderosae]KAH1005408.1 hypothetical protein HUJ04_006401 [Dendroctonus ponderosae]KAH1012504.1 hypothetical protein HUJ05_011652 [Dendroctonus ponderosae]